MQNAIFIVALGGAIGCFIVYLVVTLKLIPEAQKKTAEAAERMKSSESMGAVTPAQVTEIIKALASLAESLAKAGPALWSLIGSLLFLLVASIAAGLIIEPPKAVKQPDAKSHGAAQKPAKSDATDANAAGTDSHEARNAAE